MKRALSSFFLLVFSRINRTWLSLAWYFIGLLTNVASSIFCIQHAERNTRQDAQKVQEKDGRKDFRNSSISCDSIDPITDVILEPSTLDILEHTTAEADQWFPFAAIVFRFNS